MLNRRDFIVASAATAALAGNARGAVRDAASAHALIVNLSYRETAGLALSNTSNDGALIADRLRRLSFGSVTRVEDPDENALHTAVAAFAATLKPADTAMLYVAAHGAQIGNSNYILLEDGKTFVDLMSLIQMIRAASGTTLVFLDACRNNPFEGAAVGGGTRAVRAIDARGLQRVDGGGKQDGGFVFRPVEEQAKVEHIGSFALRGTGVRVVFATDPTNVALDAGSGSAANSPFASAVAARIAERRSLDEIVALVTGDVVNATRGAQSPWSQGSLGRLIYLAGQPKEKDGARPPFQVPG